LSRWWGFLSGSWWGENRAVAMGHGSAVVFDSMDEKFNVEFW
jgi:hypothetical protein